jgi:hypothetical protein
LLRDSQCRCVSIGGLQCPQDSVVRWRKHNDDTLVLACHLMGDVLLLSCPCGQHYDPFFAFSLYMFVWFGLVFHNMRQFFLILYMPEHHFGDPGTFKKRYRVSSPPPTLIRCLAWRRCPRRHVPPLGPPQLRHHLSTPPPPL